MQYYTIWYEENISFVVIILIFTHYKMKYTMMLYPLKLHKQNFLGSVGINKKKEFLTNTDGLNWVMNTYLSMMFVAKEHFNWSYYATGFVSHLREEMGRWVVSLMNHSLSGFKQPVENDEADKNLSFKSVKLLALLYGKCDLWVFLLYLPHIV